jgi:hypothetical protein
MLHFLINAKLFDEICMQVVCKNCDKALSRCLGLGKPSLVATTQRRQLDITCAINFVHEVGEVKKVVN